MALNDDNIKDLFSSKLSGFEPEVPASVWGGLDLLLSQVAVPIPDIVPDASSATSQSASTAAKSTSALKSTLIATGVAASIAVGVYIAYTPNVEVAEVVETIPEKVIEVAAVEEIVEEIPMLTDFMPLRKPAPVAEPEVIEELVAEPVVVQAAPQEPPVEVFKEMEVEELPPAPIIPKFLKKEISLSIKTNMGGLSANVDEPGGSLLFSEGDRSSELGKVLKEEGKEYELSHKQPISVGFTVSKKLSKKFSVETGLMFTYLSSKVKSNSVVNIKEEQTFGYLGIPININYNIYELGKANFYLSLGVMMQKDVYGRYTSKLMLPQNNEWEGISLADLSVLYTEPKYLKRNISQSNWQFSSHFTVGASYPIYRKLFIYTSVGGAYYFDAGNEYRTVFSDRKFQLDLNLGLRIDF